MPTSVPDTDIFTGVEGPSLPADERVLLATGSDLTAGAPWAAAGFVVAPWLGDGPTETLRAGLAELLRTALRRIGLAVTTDFDVAHYHRLIAGDQTRHLDVIAQTKEYSVGQLPVPVGLLEARVGALCGRPVQVHNPHTQEQVFHMRIVRPGRADHNPLHRDAWMPRYRGALNIYAPVAGKDAQPKLQQGAPSFGGASGHRSEVGDRWTTPAWASAGTYWVTCTLHPSMNLKVVVTR